MYYDADPCEFEKWKSLSGKTIFGNLFTKSFNLHFPLHPRFEKVYPSLHLKKKKIARKKKEEFCFCHTHILCVDSI